MKKRHGERGLTRVEILVVAVLCAVLLVVVIPILRSRPPHGWRLGCGTNLSGLGKAMLIYANDYGDRFPRAGGPDSLWAARLPDWKAQTRQEAYGIEPNDPGQASISASLYLLIKYAEVDPKWFVCPQEEGTIRFKRRNYGVWYQEAIDLWDFGPDPPKHVSYAYHQPYNKHFLTVNSPSDMAVAADRNPWMDSPFAKARPFSRFKPDIDAFNGTHDEAVQGNAFAHKGEGQNVLFLDGHGEFAKRSYCGLDDDNIYTAWDGADKVRGKPAQFGRVPADREDSLLVNDPAAPPAR